MHGCDMLYEYIQIPLFFIYTCIKEVEYTDNFLRVFNIKGSALIIVIMYSDEIVP